MKLKFFAILISCSLGGSMTAPLFAQDQGKDESTNPAVDEITVPEGTEFKLQLHTTINSSTSKPSRRGMFKSNNINCGRGCALRSANSPSPCR